MERKKNDLDPKVFEEAKNRIKAAFPYEGLRMGFFTNDPQGASVFGGIAKVAKTVLMNIVGDSINIRAYRLPKESDSDVRYKVDEYRGVNRQVIDLLNGPEVPDHHIKHDVPDDMMKQNHMTFEIVPDGEGGLKPNIQADGMVKTYVNFPDPTEEMLRKLRERPAREDPPADSNH